MEWTGSAGFRIIRKSLVSAIARRGLNPYAYLKDLLTRLPQMKIQQVPEVLPAV